jgi:hypothetical protein
MTALGKICKEMCEVSQKVHSHALQNLRKQLEILDILEHQRQMLHESLTKNPFKDLQQEFNSYYQLNKYLQYSPSFTFIEPTELTLGGDTCTFQYISIVGTISTIVQDPGFSPQSPSEDGLLCGVNDGSAYAENPFFLKNRDALTIEIYSDAIKLANPLGASHGKHKIVNVYFSLGELP